MHMRIKTILPFFLLFFLLIGCTQDTSTYMQDPISLSGDTSYYAAMDPNLRKNALTMRHIEVSGIVSASGYTTIFVGDEEKDGISFSCTFSERVDAVAAFKKGDMVQLHGVCTAIVRDIIYLEHCKLSEVGQTSPTTDTTGTSAPADPTTVPPTSPPTTVPLTTVPPTTVPSTTAPSTTVPPTTQIPTTSAPTESVTGGILFIKWSETVLRNETAEVTIQGKPETEYTITVNYKSGPSKAKGLEPKASDSNGFVTWTWKVGGKTSPGTFTIVVSGGGEQETVKFTVKSQ